MGKKTQEGRRPGSNRLGTILFGKGQRIISDKYREGWERTFGGKKKKDRKSD